jgi:cell division protease FtsH
MRGMMGRMNAPSPRPPGMPPVLGGSKLPPRRSWLLFGIILLVNYFLVTLLFPQDAPLTVPYTVFREQAGSNNITAIYSRGTTIEGRFRAAVTWPTPDEVKQANQKTPRTALDRHLLPPSRTSATFTTELPAFFDRDLEAFLIQHNVEISAVPIQQGSLWTTLLYFAPTLLIIGFYVWMYRRATQGGGMGGAGGMFGIGRSRAKRYDAADPANRITFDDVAGIDEAEAELVEIVDFLKAPAKYTRLGGTAPKGVLLIGSPGTGKTLLAKAVAGEAGVPFFSMSAAEFVEMIVGVGAARVRDLFKQARESAPAIIFIDEIDAIGRARGQFSMGGHSEQEQTLQQILTEMDGFSGREGIIVLAATNAPDILDRALLRPGRFDRRVVVNLPDKAGREAILRVHVRKVPLAQDVHLEELAQATPGFSGADLKNLVNEAALLAARRNESAVTHKDFLDALEKIVLGPERPLLLTPEDRERIAYHESGHAILGLVVAGADPVHRVSIVPRGQALGVTYQRPQTDRYNYPEAYLRARIIGMLGGRAAEEIVYGTRTTGAENDIEQATQIARNMVTRWGMSEAVGMVQVAPRDNPFLGTPAGFGGDKPISEQTAALVDAEVQRIINECHEEAKRLLREHRAALDGLVAALLKKETLSEEEILQATGLPPAPQLEGRALRA